MGSKVCRAYALAHWVILQSCIASHRIADDAASRMAAKQKLMTITESQRFSFQPNDLNAQVTTIVQSNIDRPQTLTRTQLETGEGKQTCFQADDVAIDSQRSLSLCINKIISCNSSPTDSPGARGVVCVGITFSRCLELRWGAMKCKFSPSPSPRAMSFVSFRLSLCFLFSMSLIINVYSSTNQRRAVE